MKDLQRVAEMAHEYKVFDTETLAKANRMAIERHYNRSLTDEFFEKADPKGIHVIHISMIHEHAEGKPVAPHMRCGIYAKLLDKMEPTEVWLDVDMDTYESLPSALEMLTAKVLDTMMG